MQKAKFKRLQKAQEEIKIAAEFQLEGDLRKAFELIENSNTNVFITGNAGTGKSSLLNYFRKYTTKKNIVLAPTGVAAVNVGGMTIHSFFGFPFRTIKKEDPDIKKWNKSNYKAILLKESDTLIIDEVSMVRADVLDGIDYSLRIQTGFDIPFGGKQVVLIGDVFQLNPIEDKFGIENDPEEASSYKSPYFFSSNAFKQNNFHVIELKKIYRQSDENFIDLLNKVRCSGAEILDIELLNKRCIYKEQPLEFGITLSTTNKIANEVNRKKLEELVGDATLYLGSVSGDFPEGMQVAEKELWLKVGAQIMMLNNDMRGRWVNGTLGKIKKLTLYEITVEFSNGRTEIVELHEWENKTYKWEKESREIVRLVKGTFKQFPLRLAWAITIHKSQGLTFDEVIIDIGRGAFAHGQVYVALSRCKTLEGIYLKTPIRTQDIRIDPIVTTFQNWYRKKFQL